VSDARAAAAVSVSDPEHLPIGKLEKVITVEALTDSITRRYVRARLSRQRLL